MIRQLHKVRHLNINNIRENISLPTHQTPTHRYWSFFYSSVMNIWKDVLSHSYSNTLLNREFVFRCFEMLLRFKNLCSMSGLYIKVTTEDWHADRAFVVICLDWSDDFIISQPQEPWEGWQISSVIVRTTIQANCSILPNYMAIALFHIKTRLVHFCPQIDCYSEREFR